MTPAENLQTWESASQDTPPPAPVETLEPVQDAAPAEIPTADTPLETAAPAPLEAEPEAVRESESPTPEPEPVTKDDYVGEADDPQEIAALPTPSAKKWAKRQFQDAAPIRAFLDFEKPIQAFGDDLYNRSPSRYFEHVKDVADLHKDDISKILFGVSFEDAKARLANGQPATTTPPAPVTPDTQATLPTEREIEELEPQVLAQRLQEWQQAQQRAQEVKEAQLRTEMEGLRQQLDAVSGKVTTQEQRDRQTQVMQIQNELYTKVWSVVDEGIRNSGLEVQPTDPPKIANLKRAATRILDKANIEAAFDESEDNRKLVTNVVEYAKRLEKANAFREEDNLKVRARAAFEKVKESPEVKAILEQIEEYANQSKAKPRAAHPVPPAPGSSTGVVIKPPTTWDEAERPTAA